MKERRRKHDDEHRPAFVRTRGTAEGPQYVPDHEPPCKDCGLGRRSHTAGAIEDHVYSPEKS